ncbi:RtcB family protein [Desulfofustis glycolicus]|uniref:3'-phosphate/5'-hydroxy nucleic acid ligase n=1 Tax=Desulfofustis glycolicus DSM 9705 TaxID=1121409 RepID=A0A1M5THD8_9BACT|nr:RtcB family protein [Desulfofustis glycolicus]SHH50235.1 tRNA-splicing ligase RtcB [Desulfofustis glycolicus DSM 9705]
MKQTITSEAIPIKLWLDDLAGEALKQARNLANLPFAVHHIAVMPDAHVGYGMPIGAILAADGIVVPNAVGVDIGCGMSAIKTSLSSIEIENLKQVLQSIRTAVPLGFKHHRQPQPLDTMPPLEGSLTIVEQEYEAARTQIGTLGGGNHFIEIQRGRDRAIWFMVHSGSRNIGFRVAGHYNKLAVSLSKRWQSTVPASWQLAGLPLDSKEGQNYFREMSYCVDFARANRSAICRRVRQALLDEVSAAITFAEPVDIAHNYAAIEQHFGKRVIVHRKGATRATTGEKGIIPGSQGSNSYLVRGMGNPESFTSCSHGAGRKMGRKQAQKNLDLDHERRRLEAQGIVHAIRGRRDLEEAAGAYKDIERVIANQQDLVEVIDILTPLAVIKG